MAPFTTKTACAALVYSVVPTKVLAFSKGTFGQTRHLL